MTAVAESKWKSIDALVLSQAVKCLSLPQSITTLAIQQWSNIKSLEEIAKYMGKKWLNV